MRIIIDLTALLPEATGVDNFLRRLVLALGRVDRQNDYRVCVNYEDRDIFRSQLPDNFSIWPLGLRPRPMRLAFQQAILPLLTAAWWTDVVHSPSFIMPYVRAGARHVLMVHDMTSFSHPECHLPLRRSRPYQQMVLTSLRRADIVTVPSRATRQAILKFVPDLRPDQIRVTVPGIGEEFGPCDPQKVWGVVTRLGLPQPYILYVGTVEPRKNLPALVESYRRLVMAGEIKERLVIAGRLGWGYEELLKRVQSPELRGKVHLVGYVDQNDLPFVYAGASLFVYPSIQEGFGFPPLEAMACGVPVVSTLSTSLLENLDGAAELVQPDDVASLTAAIRRLLTDDVLRAKRQAQGFERARQYRWDKTARNTVACYRAAVASKGWRCYV